MITEGKGLVCVPLAKERINQLELGPMYHQVGADPFKTAWRISVDAAMGTTTGISAFDRARTIEVLISSKSTSQDLIKPGHVFPLEAKEGGVLVRAGHTEAAVDLAKLAELYPAGVICEIMNDDGSMARVPELKEFVKKYNLKLITIADLIDYRRRHEKLIERVSEVNLPTKYGIFKGIGFKDKITGEEHFAMIMGNIGNGKPVLTRVHSECLTGDVFGSLRCDCGEQLSEALQKIANESRGILLYMRQEGRGIGLINKLKRPIICKTMEWIQ